MEVSPANASTIGTYDALSDEALASMDPDGGFLRRTLLNPAIFELLGDLQGLRILDAGCGQGYLARLLAAGGAEVVAVEPAARLLGYAEAREQEAPAGITYLQRDLSRLGPVGPPFDAVVANMVLLDIADWREALANCIDVLKPDGRLVYSLQHPSWVSGHFEEWAEKGHVEISEYLNEYESTGPAGRNFHRPLSVYLNATIALGGHISALIEPRLSEDDVEEPAQRLLCHVPPFVVVGTTRSRRASPGRPRTDRHGLGSTDRAPLATSTEGGGMAETVKVTGLDHIVLNVDDVERSLHFYVDLLGLEPVRVEAWRRKEAFFPSVRVNATTIIDLLSSGHSGENLDHFCLVVEPISFEELKASGRFEVVDGPARRSGAQGDGTSIYVCDPDGNRVELRYYEPGPETPITG